MSYRERQIRQILKQEQAKWGQEKGILQQDLLNLAKSIDVQVLNQEREKNEKLQKALDSLIATLGSEDIKNLVDLKTLLKGQTLKSLLGIYQAKQASLETQLLNLAKQKLATKKEARELLSQLEENWTQKEQEWKEQTENQKAANNELSAEKSTLQEKLTFYTESLKTKEQIISENQAEIQALKETNQAQQTKITNLTNQLTEQTRLNGELNQAKNQLQTSLLEKEAKLAKHKNKKALTKEEIKHLTESITDYQEKQRVSEERMRDLEEKENQARQTLSQLLVNREAELRELESEEVN